MHMPFHPNFALSSVIFVPQASAVEALLNAGASPASKNHDGLRPVDIALPVPWDEVVASVYIVTLAIL